FLRRDSMKKMLDQLQAEFHQDAETLATLQTIYADKVKQIRTNRTLPPDIQQRFLTEWEQFYDQRISTIFNYNGGSYEGVESSGDVDSQTIPSPPVVSPPAARLDADNPVDFGIETMENRSSKKGRA
ncbi:MAG: hypothetical protein AB1489_41655, partial [Acidobacteriota bacterium]